MNLKKSNVKENDDLPVSRKQVFFRSFRNEYFTILLVSVFMTLFAIPLLMVLFLTLVQLAALSGGDMTVTSNVVAVYSARASMYFWCIPALMVLAVGASGGFYVIRRLVWNQNVKFFRDFGNGIKSNILQFEIVTIIFSLFSAGVCYGTDMLVLNFELGGFYPFLRVIQVFLLLVAFAFLLFQYCEIVVYKSSIFKQIQNSFILALGSFPMTIVILIGVLAPLLLLLLLMLFQSVLLLVAISTIMALVGFGYSVLLITLHCHHVFDRHVNKKNYPEIYRRGLYDAESAQKNYDQENNRQY